jgi:hypothetical protein
MSTRSTLPFLVVVFVVALAGTFLAMTLFNNNRPARETTLMATVQIIITATIDPNLPPAVTIVTATPDNNRTQVVVPASIVTEAAGTVAPQSTRPAFDIAGAQALNPDVAETATALPQNCILHTIVEGDTPFGIAEQYGANGFVMLDANGLTEETATGLQIGDTLIVPLEGCPVESLATYQQAPRDGEPTFTNTPAVSATPTQGSTEEATPAESPTPRPSPTITLAPTAANAQIAIVGIEKIGDVTLEGVMIRNDGKSQDITGWTLSDSEGTVYTFKEKQLFSQAQITVSTRIGEDTPQVSFWGLDRAVWSVGDVVTLKDTKGQVIATRRIDESALP